jgi:hypothetical protein
VVDVMIKEVIHLSSKRKIFKGGCGGCYPTFRVSSCPLGPRGPQGEQGIQGEPGTAFTPVYGSLYVNTINSAVTGHNVKFDTDGPFSGVTLTGSTITVDSPGVYTISFSTVVSAFNPFTQAVSFTLSINGTPDFTKDTEWSTEVNSIVMNNTLSRTDQLMLNQGDFIRIFIISASSDIIYYNSALVVTKVA